MKKTGTSASGVFTIKEYMFEGEPDPVSLIRRLQAGPGKVQEIVTYVFAGDDPLGLDAKSFSAEAFLDLYPQTGSYGSGLAFDVVVSTEGHPLTVEMTKGDRSVSTNSLDRELELEDLLGECKSCPESESRALTPKELLEILSVAEKLKCNTRHCDTSSGRRESVAEHSWRAALMAMLLSGQQEYAELDMNRVIRMCLIHDLGEAFTGDIPTFDKTRENEEEEEKLFRGWIGGFPGKLREEFESLFEEMRQMQTEEAKLYKALDKMEAVIQHNESDLSSWLPLEYDLQLTYGAEEVRFSPFLCALKEEVDEWTRRKTAGSAKAGGADPE